MARPTLQDILTRVSTAIKSRLPGTNPQKRVGILPAIHFAVGGASNELHGRIDQEKKSMHPLWARGAAVRAWCALFGVPQPPGTQAVGVGVATGNDGAEIVVGETLLLGNVEYITTEQRFITAGSATVPVKAKDAGKAGNAPPGVQLKFTRTLSGVNSTVIINGDGITGGTNAANDDDLHDGMQFYFTHPPGAGNDDDYKRWTREASPLVTNVWVTRREQTGASVTIRVMTYGATDNGIPSEEVLSAIRDYVLPRAPTTADIFVLPPVPEERNLVFSELVPDTEDARAAILQEFIDMLQREAAPGGVMPWSQLYSAVAYAGVVNQYQISTPSPTPETFSTGHIPVAGTISVGEV